MGHVDVIQKKKSIRENILALLSKITRVDYTEISDDVLIREELGIDSLIAIELLANIELMYDIKIDENLVSDIDTVGDFIGLIESIVMNN